MTISSEVECSGSELPAPSEVHEESFVASSSRLKICFIGWGAIARRASELLQKRNPNRIQICAVAVRERDKPRDALPQSALLITEPSELSGVEPDIVIEAAGRASVEPWGSATLKAGVDFFVSSTSAFCAPESLSRLIDIAEATGARVVIPPGALGGIDALSAASTTTIDEVYHSIIKPPSAWRSTPAEKIIDLDHIIEARTFFEGTARQAASEYPSNANSAVITAMAANGLDKTKVALIADPEVSQNTHHIRARGSFGHLDMKVANAPLATNPKSSEMTALNIVRCVEQRIRECVL